MEDTPTTAMAAKQQSLEQRQRTLRKKLIGQQQQLDLETRVEEQMRLEYEVAKSSQQLQALEKELAGLKVPQLIMKANNYKNTNNYAKALELWHEIYLLQADNPLIESSLASLKSAQATHSQCAQLRPQLARHLQLLKPVWADLMDKLKKPSDSIEFQGLLQVTADYLAKEMSADEFVMWYQAEMKNDSAQAPSNNLAGIADRIKRGDMVLFLGADIAMHYQEACLNDQGVANTLAERVHYKNFNGTLSSIAEYCQARPDIGTNTLLDHLDQHLPNPQQRIQFYQHLAQTQVAQVLITAAYDELLERAFLEAGKPFVKLSAFVNKSRYYEIGHVKVHYSDGSQVDQILMEEVLSKMKFIENGYSVIYKIRGTCNKNDVEERDALILSERHFFDFARYARRIIPSNLVHEIRKRGFLFLGHHPRSWEDRLLVKALLEKRQYADEPCYVLTRDAEPMGEAHWKQHNVERFAYELPDLDACFQQDIREERL